MHPDIQIIDSNASTVLQTGVCGYKSPARPGFPEKVEWLTRRFEEGLRLLTLVSKQDGTQGMIEYIPGEVCWRPVEASGYMLIHCLFVGFKKTYKHRGLASQLIERCIAEARNEKKRGVAVVTRKGAFMVGSDIFLKHDFQVVDTAPSDFELLALKFDPEAPSPQFKNNADRLSEYSHGLTIIRANQCPYTVKNVQEIVDTAKQTFDITPRIVNVMSYQQAQRVPHAFRTFCIVYEGKVIAEHPISKTRFVNIMKKLQEKE